MTRLRTVCLSLVLAAVVLAAHPIGALRPLSYTLWEGLAVAGIDVAMTPLTFDMMLMRDTASGLSLYAHDVELHYRTAEGTVELPPERLPLYRWRIPVILFFEETWWRADTRGHRHALCHELARQAGPGSAFLVRLAVRKGTVEPYGINVWQECP